MSSDRKPATAAIHAGSRLPDSSAVPITPAVHTAAVSWFDSADELDAALDGKDFVYTRIRAENSVLLEEAVAALEGAEAAAVFGSGMAALRAVFDAQGLASGDRVVLPADGYGALRATRGPPARAPSRAFTRSTLRRANRPASKPVCGRCAVATNSRP